ncbi:hypothetical protein MOQ72_24620 [Saccharopolyspora sp. K220]|uniref:hypothetical protein n=1 Tax=Saccharopolyspora soli TaxID=2926618 RepID=UPI001F597FB3|nr:hypothetical protein [Saccharopolyspora soli]MCI2420640.1 hypothetical protein [Saccharopolyspora soli]
MSTIRWTQFARGPLARLVAVLTVVAGLALLHTPQCADGMTPAVHMAAAVDHMGSAPCPASVAASADAAGVHDQHLGTAIVASHAGGEDVASFHSGMLMSCLALLIVALGMLAILRRPDMSVVMRLRETGVPATRPNPTPRPNLAQLCVLRT